MILFLFACTVNDFLKGKRFSEFQAFWAQVGVHTFERWMTIG
jgi:hypothetical protein